MSPRQRSLPAGAKLYAIDLHLEYCAQHEQEIRRLVESCSLFEDAVERPANTGSAGNDRILLSGEVAGHRVSAVLATFRGRLDEEALALLRRLVAAGCEATVRIAVYHRSVAPTLSLTPFDLATMQELGFAVEASFYPCSD